MRGKAKETFPLTRPLLIDRDRDQPVVVRLVSGEIPQTMAKNLGPFPKTSFRDEGLQDLIMKCE
jgi:hypothetical protein